MHLAFDAHRSYRSGLKPFYIDLKPAIIAYAEGVVVDAFEGFFDLLQEALFPAAQAKHEVRVCFGRCLISHIREHGLSGKFIQRHFSLGEKCGLLLKENALYFLEL